MKKSFLPSTILLMTLFLFTCSKKENVAPTPNFNECFIQSLTYTSPSGQDTFGIMTFEYDSAGKISKQISRTTQGNPTIITTYKYYTDKIVSSDCLTTNYLLGRNFFYLNQKGLADGIIEVGYGTNGDSTIQRETHNLYDPNGYLIESNSTINQEIFTGKWHISGGNISWYEFSRSSWPTSKTEYYEYLSFSTNTVGNTNMGKGFLGRSNLNLIRHSIVDTILSEIINYSYEFDSKNRVIKELVRGKGLTYADSVNLIITYYN